MKKKYGLHGYLKAQKGNGPQLAGILLKAADLVSSSEGCHLYMVSTTDDPDIIWITEVWENREFHDRSLEIQGVRELIEKAMTILDEMPQKGQELSVWGGFASSLK